MITFFIALVILIVGYMTYGVVVEKAFKPDDRPTPAIEYADGVDFVEMKPWRIFLIQLLNIAGLGPIFGAIAGALWDQLYSYGSYSVQFSRVRFMISYLE